MNADSFAVLLTLWLFVLGLCAGSFLNVVIARVPAGYSIVRPRSRCPRCGHQLSWYENIPVLSWLMLRGRCRGCGQPISLRYPLIELLTGVLFVACLLRFGWTYELAGALVFVGLLIPLTFIDAEHWILPFELTLPGIAAGVLLSIPLGPERFEGALWGVAVGFIAFRAMEYLGWLVFRREALGGGDKYLLALLGAFLTHWSLLGVVFLASFQGAIFGLVRLMLTGRAGPTAPAPLHATGREADIPLPPPPPTEEAPPTMTWRFLAQNLPLWRRALLVPVSLLFQPIPDAPEEEEEEGAAEIEWTPGASSLPFGPWLALAGLEVMLLGPWLRSVLPPVFALLVTGHT
ncbi:MAG: prepilin peptidase [Myxococcaceae bacterium]|nr:prepilin peptidase [Myxococcaceae bacterium]MCI0673783.1 prepilin peptidase [Myxococcaceae bacterium]